MPAPLDPAAVDAVCAEPLYNARTLPADAYTAESMLAWERQHAIEPAWSCVARSCDLAKGGDQRAVPVGTQTVLLARGNDGSLNAFYNSCRHRGHELLPAGQCVNRRTITCPYHAWVYNLQGELKSATRFMDTEHFEASAWPLLPLSCVEWNGWVFVQADASGPSFPDWVGNLDEILGPYRIAEISIAASHEYVVEANWKTIIENYLECYHCPSIHPELCRVSPPESAQAFVQSGYWLGGPMDLMDDADTMSLDGSGGAPVPGLTGELTRKVCYFVLPPSLLISTHPDYVMTHRLTPLKASQTYVECAWLFPDEVIATAGFDPSYAANFWDITNRQDFSACESVARGLHSRGYRPGPFDEREDGVRAFQEQLARLYRSDRWDRPRGAEMGKSALTAPGE